MMQSAPRAPLTAASFTLWLSIAGLAGCGASQIADHTNTAASTGGAASSSPPMPVGGALANGGAAPDGGAVGGAGATRPAPSGQPALGGTGGASTSTASGGSGAQDLMHADFQARPAGLYTQEMVSQDFGGKPTWNDGLDEGRASIVDERGERFLRVTYAAGIYGPADGGVQFLVPLSGSSEELYLSYRVRFASGFDFVRGGKLPGLVGGTHPTGCVADAGGFSARMMWRTGGAAVQYLYFPDKVNACGDDFTYRANNADLLFKPGTWHRVLHRIRMNTPGQNNGILQAWFDGALALDNTTFNYRISGATFAIDALYFSTFFGGSDATWAPAQAQIADFDDFVVADHP